MAPALPFPVPSPFMAPARQEVRPWGLVTCLIRRATFGKAGAMPYFRLRPTEPIAHVDIPTAASRGRPAILPDSKRLFVTCRRPTPTQQHGLCHACVPVWYVA